MVTAQRGMEALEVRVSAGDDCWRFIAAARLNDVEGIELGRDEQNVYRHAGSVIPTPDPPAPPSGSELVE